MIQATERSARVLERVRLAHVASSPRDEFVTRHAGSAEGCEMCGMKFLIVRA